MFKIFFLILHSKIRYGELVGEFDIIIRFVLAFEVLESIDYFGFLYDFLFETFFRKDVRILKEINRSVEHVYLVCPWYIILLIVNIFYKILTQIQLIRGLEITGLSRFQS